MYMMLFYRKKLTLRCALVQDGRQHEPGGAVGHVGQVRPGSLRVMCLLA